MLSLEQDWTLLKCTPNRFPPVSSGKRHNPLTEECSGGGNNTKTKVVVAIVDIVPVTIRRTAIARIVVPRPAALFCLSHQ